MKSRNPIDQMKEELTDKYSFKDMFQAISSHQSKVAAEYIDNRLIKQITYAEYEIMTRSAAYQIARQIGAYRQNCFVGLKMDNNPYWPVLFWGILMAGYKPLLLDFRLDESATRHLLAEAGAAAIILSARDRFFTDLIKIEAEKLWENEIEVPANWNFPWADEMALCTSGTTETARVFVYDSYAMAYNLLNQYDLSKINSQFMPEGEARILAFVPFHHIFGFVVSYLPSSIIGKTIIYMKDRAPSTILQACQVLRVTHIYSIPLLWNNIASAIMKEVKQSSQSKQLLFNTMCALSLFLQRISIQSGQKAASVLFAGVQKKLLGQDIILLGCGGGAVLPQTLKVLNAIGYNLICGYGMTEAGVTSTGTGNDIKQNLKASLGGPLGLTEYKIAAIAGQDDTDEGELYIKGPGLHTARMKDGICLPPLTNEEGWLATGDIAVIKNGTMWLRGRLKEVIINESGENVYPDELEELFNLEDVEQLCILGVKNSASYEDITLILYDGDDCSPEWQERNVKAINRINSRLPIYKRLNQVLLSKDPLPVANNMKIQRSILKEQLEQGIWPCTVLDTRAVETAVVDYEDPYKTEDIYGSDLVSLRTNIKDYIARVLSISVVEIGDESHFIEDLGGDSLSSLELLIKLEEKYDISIPDEEYFRCNNANELSLLLYEILQKNENGDSSGDLT